MCRDVKRDPVDVTISVPLPPAGAGRPRTKVVKPKDGPAFAQIYKAKPDEQWQGQFAAVLAERVPPVPLESALRVDLLIVLPRTKALLQRFARPRPDGHGPDRTWKHPTGLIPAPVKPDRDNVDKAVLDSMRSFYRTGDQQVCDGRLLKCHAEVDGIPRVVVRIREIPGDAGYMERAAAELGLLAGRAR